MYHFQNNLLKFNSKFNPRNSNSRNSISRNSILFFYINLIIEIYIYILNLIFQGRNI